MYHIISDLYHTNEMSIINRKLQFQLILLRSTFGAAFGAASHIVYSPNRYLTYDADSTATYGAAYNATCRAALNATSRANSRATHNATSNIEPNISKKEKDFDTRMLLAFREVLKWDNKIQEDVKADVMIIPYDCRYPISEVKLVESLMAVDVSKMTPMIQTYWIYSMYNVISTINNVDDYTKSMALFKVKNEGLTVPDEYKELLKPIDLKFINSLLLPELTVIVEEYYYLSDREGFISSLLNIDNRYCYKNSNRCLIQ